MRRENNDRNEPYEVQGILLNQTDKAYLVAIDNDKEMWLAKSQCENVSIKNDEIVCDIPVWLAIKAKLV